MKTNLTRQREEVFTNLRASLSRLNLPVDLVEELIERHMAVAFEKGAFAFCEGNTDGMLACILSGYVNVYCPVGDGGRTLVRMAGPGEIIGYPDYVDEKGRHARLFEAQAASKCTLALFSCEHVARLLAGLPADALISILAALNTFSSENLPLLYDTCEPPSPGPPHDRVRRFGEASRGTNSEDNPNSRSATRCSPSDRLLSADNH